MHKSKHSCHNMYLWLSASHWSELSEGGGEEGGVEERGTKEFQDVRSKPLPHGSLQEADHHIKQGGGKMDAHLDHVL